ncbi:MAG: FHA domain-containing protein [Muribaculaceae bacterium]|nr:FHA domain-containing protein [Muribaculaceae bacterium]
MKIISIGRGVESNIIIDNDLVSRRHATIKLMPFGKMEIRDLSKNGTYVNGIRLASNKPYPVTRKDVVSFAQVAQLDWDQVPDLMRPYRLCGIGLLVIIAACVIISLVNKIDWGGNDNDTLIEQYDSTPAPKPEENTKEKEKEKKDTVKDADKNVKFFQTAEEKEREKKRQEERRKKKEQDEKKKKQESEQKKDEPKKTEEQSQQWHM